MSLTLPYKWASQGRDWPKDSDPGLCWCQSSAVSPFRAEGQGQWECWGENWLLVSCLPRDHCPFSHWVPSNASLQVLAPPSLSLLSGRQRGRPSGRRELPSAKQWGEICGHWHSQRLGVTLLVIKASLLHGPLRNQWYISTSLRRKTAELNQIQTVRKQKNKEAVGMQIPPPRWRGRGQTIIQGPCWARRRLEALAMVFLLGACRDGAVHSVDEEGKCRGH